MSLASLFAGTGFKSTVKRYCDEIGWRTAEIDNDHATIRFRMDSGRTQTLWIIRYQSTMEFSVPSMAAFDDEDDIPGYLSTLLLQRSAQSKIGFWCIEHVSSKYVYTCMCNAELELVNRSYFERVVSALVAECDKFEGILIEAMRRR